MRTVQHDEIQSIEANKKASMSEGPKRPAKAPCPTSTDAYYRVPSQDMAEFRRALWV